MTTRPSRCPSRRRGADGGFALVTTLMFMVAALVLGISVLGVGVMQERIIGNTRDRDLAFQAAEAALRDAEADIAANGYDRGVFTAGCDLGLCSAPTQRIPPDPRPVDKQAGFSWAAATKVRTYGQYTLAPPLPEVPLQPAYVIEWLGKLDDGGGSLVMPSTSSARTGYRITARATGARPETVVFLQSIYANR